MKRQRAEGRGQRGKDRGQRGKVRGQKAEGRGQIESLTKILEHDSGSPDQGIRGDDKLRLKADRFPVSAAVGVAEHAAVREELYGVYGTEVIDLIDLISHFYEVIYDFPC